MIKVVRVELIPQNNNITKKETVKLLYLLQKEIVGIANDTIREWYIHSLTAFNNFNKLSAEEKKVQKYSGVIKAQLNGKSMMSYLNSRYALKNLSDEEKYNCGTRTVAQLINNVLKTANKNFKDVMANKKSLPTYRDTTPIPFANDSFKIKEGIKNGYEVDIRLLNSKSKIADKSNYNFRILKLNKYQKPIIDRLVAGIYKQGEGDIILKGSKILFNIMYNTSDTDINTSIKRNENISLGVMFSEVENKLVLSVSEGNAIIKTINIPTDDVERFHNRYRRLRQGKNANNLAKDTGHGIKRLFKNSNMYAKKWQNFQNTYCHKLSKTIIRYANIYNASSIIIEDVTMPKMKKIGSFTYFDLYSKIAYKAQEENITFNKIAITRKNFNNESVDEQIIKFLLHIN